MVKCCLKRLRLTSRDIKMSLRDTFRRLIAGPETAPVPSLGRNDRCWCGSGRKYKICHQAVDDRRRSTMQSAPHSARRGTAARGY
jgi:hypothetical protein